MKLQKTVHSTKNQRFTQRLHIKEFPSTEDAYDFLAKQCDNQWKEYEGDLKKGVYAFAGGTWHNVKKLDASVLAHI
jgi:hypothetical protein